MSLTNMASISAPSSVSSLFRSSASALSICTHCQRSFSTTSHYLSGHSKWSKIKHEKGVADGKKSALRGQFVSSIVSCSRMYGPDPSKNPALASALAAARKASIPKTITDQAISRGQGRTAAGAKLEAMTFEFMGPGSVALIADIETDNRKRTQFELVTMAKKQGARSVSTEYLFRRLGLNVLRRKSVEGDDSEASGIVSKDSLLDEIMNDALEAGAEDLEEDDEGNVMVYSEPNSLSQVGQALSSSHDLEVLSSEMVWVPIEDTRVQVEDLYDVRKLKSLVDALQAFPEVQAVYANGSKGAVPEDEWESLEDALDNTM